MNELSELWGILKDPCVLRIAVTSPCRWGWKWREWWIQSNVGQTHEQSRDLTHTLLSCYFICWASSLYVTIVPKHRDDIALQVLLVVVVVMMMMTIMMMQDTLIITMMLLLAMMNHQYRKSWRFMGSSWFANLFHAKSCWTMLNQN